MLEHEEIKKLHDKAFQANQITREQASDDLVFYWVTQWDDQLLTDSQLQYRGQFDIVRKAGRQILAALKQNIVQPDFKPKDESRNDDAEFLDGFYRASDRDLSSQEAYDYARQDMVVCGFGAWELYTEYETNRVGDEKQVIRRRYIPEANNNLFWDPNAVKLDKSDAKYCSILYRYSEDGYKDLVEDITGERPDNVNMATFANPEESYTFPWVSEQNKIYVACFYHKKKIKDKVIVFADPFGSELTVRLSQVNEVMDELIGAGYNVKAEVDITRWQVTKYIVSGAEILEEKVIAGESIPVIPCYGERTVIEGEEYYEGIVRLAKDPQRLRNFQMSYLADIVSRSPRNKPIFFPEQVEGFESMYEEGADNNYPYYLVNRKTATGEDLPPGVAGQMPDQNIPPALAASIQLSREAVEDVANPGLPQDIADPDLSGKAVYALQARLDQQSYAFQHNFKFAKRRDAEIWAGMASEIIDTPRTVMIETPDGQTQQVKVMETVIDSETGNPVVLRDITNMEFDVYAEIGQEYQTQKQQTREQLIQIASALDPNDPLRNIVTMKALQLMDGVELDDVRKHINKMLLSQGIKEPETDEDMMIMQQLQQQQQQPDPATMMAQAQVLTAQAEQMKGQAALMREQRGAQRDQADVQMEGASMQIDAFKAQTDRGKMLIDAREKDVNVKNRSIEAEGKQLENQMRSFELGEVEEDAIIGNASNAELANILTTGV